jgi:hypothetical protein
MGNFFFTLFEIREKTFFEIKRYGWVGDRRHYPA